MTSSSEVLDERAQANRARAQRLAWESAAPLGAVIGVLVAVVVALLVHVIVGIVAGLVVGAAITYMRVRTGTAGAVDRILAAVGARPASEAEHPRYFNLIEGLSISTGIEEPALHVVDDPGANALAVGPPGGAAVVVTTGLLEHLARVELEGVLAEALYRIRVHEADLGAAATVFVGGPLLRANTALDAPPSGLAGKRVRRLHRLLDDRRHLVADISASAMTRYPPGLRDAFSQLQVSGTAVAACPYGVAHLWMCDPLGPGVAPTGGSDDTEPVSFHPPIQHRIDLLAEL